MSMGQMVKRIRGALRAAAWLLPALVLIVPLIASTPTFWTVSTQTDFLKGDVEDLSIDSDGRVFLGPETKQLAETAAPFIWTVISAPDGTLFAGTGNEGQVLRITRDGKTSTLFDAQEIEVHALALAPKGGLYVGTSPDGKIYEVAADGTAKTFFDPDDKYIWALAVGRDGTVYAATGEKGTIYRITPDGKGTVFYKTNTTNVVSLAFDRTGNLIAGTESPGRIFRIDPSGHAFVLLDSPFKEIHALRVADDGSIYGAAFSGTPGGEDRATPTITPPAEPTPSRAPVPSVTTEVTAIAVVDASALGQTTPAAAREARSRNAKGAIYRIRPDGLWDTVWEAMDDWPFDLSLEKDGAILVGTGKEGKLFRIAGEPARATLLARVSARQITALLPDTGGQIVAATSNPGKLFTIAAQRAKKGTYDSDVRDAGTVASWGAIRWRASGKPGDVEITTRSGNTATPDDTWSTWSKPYTTADGESITSPKARYLQWRAVLKSDGVSTTGPVLTSVTAAYLPRNLRPVVSSITVHPPGAVFQRPFSTGELEIAGFEENTSDNRNPAQSGSQAAPGASPAPVSPALGRRVYQKGLQTFVWKADDENDDRLQYDVWYRREGETSWKALKRGLWDPIFVWDTTSVPDGTYYVKVSASDAPSNSPATALVGELESTSFDVDNTAPRIEVQSATRSGTRATVRFIVRDDQSAVQRVEYSLDASRWQVAFPLDGIADSRREDFEISIEGADAARSVIIRASDAMNNVATAVAQITGSSR
jgi:SMP-30/gluconolaconase/LRE-like protein